MTALALPKPPKRAPAPRRAIARRTRLQPGAPPKRTSRPRQQRKGIVAAARREYWRLLSLIVRKLHPMCQACGQRASTDACHVFGKGGAFAHLKLVMMNLLALCRACHQEHGSASLKHLTRMEVLYRRVNGDAAFENLSAQATVPSPRKWDPVTLSALQTRAVVLGIALKPIPASSIPY